MRIVLDTNVIVSGLINPRGMPAKILNLLVNGKIIVLYDNRILEEYSEVLQRKKFNFKKDWIEPFMDYIKNEGEYITADPVNDKFQDEDDKMFYEVAKTGKAEYIVTGNKQHFPRAKMVKNPKEFIEIYLLTNEAETI
jgi:putative PIN family toxin of toxin-antitoxin system